MENGKKPNNTSQVSQVREIVQEVLLAQKSGDEGGDTGEANPEHVSTARRLGREGARLGTWRKRKVSRRWTESRRGRQGGCVGIATKPVTTAPAAPVPPLMRKQNGCNKTNERSEPVHYAGRTGKAAVAPKETRRRPPTRKTRSRETDAQGIWAANCPCGTDTGRHSDCRKGFRRSGVVWQRMRSGRGGRKLSGCSQQTS